ncbi:LAME_0H18998g1_1 [Lachancea meyersii CBS 8951]|uniref:Thiamine pyrophosphokinase n=1 Tax=Lachancea meyersii CBS 8951 TaxID=1266667 RepID=A0A1G4KIX3_9SACH|nr:LAME_0H18998g1_1 [Lachancea meyersii CBS 8951]
MKEGVVENPDSILVEKPAFYSHVLDLNGFLSPDHDNSALLILNQKINIGEVFSKLWGNYNVHICADGGANRLYEYFADDAKRAKFVPDYIVGDLDSVRHEVLTFYLENGVSVIGQSSQYSTDFTKSLRLISLHFYHSEFLKMLKTGNFDQNYGIDDCDGLEQLYKAERSSWVTRDIDLLVLNAIDGRFDQTVHSITQLYTTSRTDVYYRLCYLTSTDLIMLIPTGGALITYDKAFKTHCIRNCGLLPLGGPTVINSTRGLKWDVTDWHTSIMEGKVSSSNRFVGEDCCFFDVKDPLVLSIELTLDRLSDFI